MFKWQYSGAELRVLFVGTKVSQEHVVTVFRVTWEGTRIACSVERLETLREYTVP